jgi:hypothetical protein
MVLEVHVSTKQDGGSLTFRIRAWDAIPVFKLFEMKFDMIPSFVHRGEVVESDFVWLKGIPEAENTLRPCRSLGKGLAFWRIAFVSDSPRSIRFESYGNILLAAQRHKCIRGADPVMALLSITHDVGVLAEQVGKDLSFF